MNTTATISTLQDLQQFPQWVCHDNEKEPFDAETGFGAKADDSATWHKYEIALQALQASDRYSGIGFELVLEQGITVIDLDKCILEDGSFTSFAQRIIQRLNSYTEISPSGRGVHIWIQGTIPKNLGSSDKEKAISMGIEMYSCKRYITITGDHLEGTPATFEYREEQILSLYNETVELRKKLARPVGSGTQLASVEIVASEQDTPYGLKALRDECTQLANTGEGGRNDQLNLSAFRIGQLIAGQKVTRATAESALYSAGQRCGLPDAEIEKHITHGLDDGINNPRKDPLQTTQPDKPFNPTDLGNAERFALRYKDTVRWCETWNTWLVFNGKCWESDRVGRVDQLAKIVVRSIYSEAAKIEDEDLRKRMAKHATASESNRAVRAMLDRAKSELPATPDDFNKHLYLFNCDNGTLDLRTGELRPHSFSDMLTRCIKTKYNPLARQERLDSFLDKFLNGDADLITFMKQSLGMSLCGDTSEQCLFICHGMGSNGKTTLLETIRIIMGSYALAANIETFQVRKTETIGNDIAELYGARLVTASETKLGGRLNEAFVKKATGKEPLRARRLHENEFEFMPEFTLWLAVNHKPVVLDTSKGMWRRVHFIPFNVTIEDEQADIHFGDKLLEEAEGILAWLVQGCMEWIQQGRLIVPQIVKEATAGYRAEMDIVANFLADECVLLPGTKVTTKQLIERFENWCGHNSEKFDAKILKASLKERGYHSQRGTGGSYYWQNIGLKASDENTQEEIWNEDISEGSEGSEPKNKVNQESKNPPDATLNSRSLPSLPSLSSEYKVIENMSDEEYREMLRREAQT